jgi:hypothetical protein
MSSGRAHMLFVSELAALADMHKYQDATEALLEAWRRVSPATFAAAQERADLHARTDEDYVAGLNLELATNKSTEAAATAAVREVLAAPLVTMTEAMAAADGPARRKAVQRAISRVPDTKLAAKLMREMDALGEKPSAAAVRRVLQGVAVQDCDKTAAGVRSVVNKRRGTANEAKGVAAYERVARKQVTAKNDRFYKGNVGTAELPCWIGGRVDGLRQDRVVEVKCRRNRLFDLLPVYERVQIHGYMFLTGLHLCDLVQKYDGQVKVDTYEFDPDFWKTVCNRLIRVTIDLHELVHDEEAQDALLQLTCG